MTYWRVFGHPVPQDIKHSVGRSPPDHKLLVTVPLISWEPCRNYIIQIAVTSESDTHWGSFKLKFGFGLELLYILHLVQFAKIAACCAY